MFLIYGFLLKFLKILFWIDDGRTKVSIIYILNLIKPQLFFNFWVFGLHIPNWAQNSWETSNLSAIFDCFKISKIIFLDSLSQTSQSFLQMKMKKSKQLSVSVGSGTGGTLEYSISHGFPWLFHWESKKYRSYCK